MSDYLIISIAMAISSALTSLLWVGVLRRYQRIVDTYKALLDRARTHAPSPHYYLGIVKRDVQ